MTKGTTFATLSLAVAIACALPAAAQTTAPADPASALRTIRERFIHSVIPTDPQQLSKLNDAARRYASTQTEDGSWPDVDYEGKERSTWAAREHLLRTLALAKADRAARDAGQPDATLHRAVLAGIACWTRRDLQNPNWWWNQIGVPQLTGEIVNLAFPDVPKDQIDRAVQIMHRSTWEKWTGQNLVWGVQIQILRGCIENDADVVAQGYQRMYDEVRVVDRKDEGIQPDFSFHQHGKQLYNGGYGLAFANDVGRFVAYAAGTVYGMPAEKMRVLNGYLLDGQQWMIRGNVFDYSAVGRELTRKGKVAVPNDWRVGPISPAGPAYSLGTVVTMLSRLPVPRQDEYASFARRLHGDADAPPFTGNKHFWCSDYMTHRRAGYLASVKMLSDRIQNAELVNDEGKKSQHLSDGVNLLYLTGDEYKDIMPVWDWNKLPGATCEQGPYDHKDIARRNKSPFTGGVSDGRYGLAAMDLKHDRLSAKKVYAFFDDAYVCLGAGITSDSDYDVVTSVNQCLLSGDVFTFTAAVPLPKQSRSILDASPAWVHHDHVGYVFPEPAKLHLSNADQTGSWADFGTGSPDPVTRPVFSLWFDHGTKPSNATYEYIVLPGASHDQTSERAKDPGLQILANTPQVQAVYHPKLKLASIAFWQRGKLETPIGAITVDQPCLLLVHQAPDGTQLTASNPASRPLTLTISVGPRSTQITLPDGPLAGSSVTQRLP